MPLTHTVNATETAIQHVTVFQSDKARIVRVFTLNIEEGGNNVIVRNVSNAIDATSISVSGLGGSVTLADVVCAIPSSSNTVQQPSDAVHVLLQRKKTLEAERGIREQEAKLLLTYGNSLSKERVSDSEFISFLDMFREERLKGVAAIQDIENQLRSLEEQISSESDADSKGIAKAKVTISLSSEKKGVVTLRLSYLVSQARWTPIYDLHASAHDADVVSLHYRAQITQSTGEDWADTELSLNTTRSEGHEVPRLDVSRVIRMASFETRPIPPQHRSLFGNPPQPHILPFPRSDPQLPQLSGPTEQRQREQMPQQQQPQSIFGQSGAALSLFGRSAAPSSPFGQSTAAPSIFGQSDAAPSLSGQSTAAPSSFTSFVQSTTAPSSFGPSAFPSSLSGQSAAAPSSFGQPTATPSSFGQSTAAPSSFRQFSASYGTTPSGTLFGASTISPPSFGVASSNWNPTQSQSFGGRLFPDAASSLFGQSTNLQATTPATAGSSRTNIEDFDDENNDAHSAVPISEGTMMVKSNTLSSSFTAQGRTNVPSDGSSHTISIASFVCDANITRICVPRLSADVYLRCRVENATQYRLLPGSVSVFLDEEYVSRTVIKNIGMNDTFECALGIDPALQVIYERSQSDKPIVEAARSFSDSAKAITKCKAHTIVRNKGPTTIKSLIIQDSLPLPSADESDKDLFKSVLRKPTGLAEASADELVDVRSQVSSSEVDAQKLAGLRRKIRWSKKIGTKGGESEGKYEWLVDVLSGEELSLVAEWDVKAPSGIRWREL